MTPPELTTPSADAARDELIASVVQYHLRFYYHAMEF
jgi:hypothetical protein